MSRRTRPRTARYLTSTPLAPAVGNLWRRETSSEPDLLRRPCTQSGAVRTVELSTRGQHTVAVALHTVAGELRTVAGELRTVAGERRTVAGERRTVAGERRTGERVRTAALVVLAGRMAERLTIG